jgi:hypothetical protein
VTEGGYTFNQVTGEFDADDITIGRTPIRSPPSLAPAHQPPAATGEANPIVPASTQPTTKAGG